MFTLKKEEEVTINIYQKPKEDLEIIFPDIDKIKRKKDLIKFLKSALKFLLVIGLFCFLVFIISNIDFNAKKKQFIDFKDQVETKFTSKTIRLTTARLNPWYCKKTI